MTKLGVFLVSSLLASFIAFFMSFDNYKKSKQLSNEVFSSALHIINYARLSEIEIYKVLDAINQPNVQIGDIEIKERVDSIYENLFVIKEKSNNPNNLEDVSRIEMLIQELRSTDRGLVSSEKWKNNIASISKETKTIFEDIVERETLKAFENNLSQETLYKNNQKYFYMAIAIAMFALFAFVVYVYHLIIFPLKQLKDDFKLFKAGKLSSKSIPNKRMDEIGALYKHFWALFYQVKENERSLLDSADHLNGLLEELKLEIIEKNKVKIELEKNMKQRELLSRQAGMHEIASEMLHNLGNILNSVNVSVSHLETLFDEQNSVDKIQKIVQKIHHDGENQEIDFIFLIAKYLTILTEKSLNSREQFDQEIETLKENLMSLNMIIQQQKKHIGSVNLDEQFDLNEAIKEVIKLNENTLVKHKVKVNTELGQIPKICLDRYQISQVLNHLVINGALSYVTTKDGIEKTFFIKTHALNDTQIEVLFKDQGIGIEKHDLNQIFQSKISHGKQSNEVDLHYSANVIKNLGGALQAFSEGKNNGACFSIVIPINRQASLGNELN